MVGTSLTSLLARSGVSLDYDLASLYQELNSKQQLDDKTAEGYYMLWRCYSTRRGEDATVPKSEFCDNNNNNFNSVRSGLNSNVSKPGCHDLSSPLMSLASSISLGQVNKSELKMTRV